jgi:hypothetical protein
MGQGKRKKHYRGSSPVAKGPSRGLWWFIHYPSAIEDVVSYYLERYGRGKEIPVDFRVDLLSHLGNLSRAHKVKLYGKKTARYWTVPAYAKASKIEPGTMMKWVRQLNKIAIELYPEEAERFGFRTKPLSEKEIEGMHLKCYEGMDIHDIAALYRINVGHAARLCKTAMEFKRLWNAANNEAGPAVTDAKAEPAASFSDDSF